MWDEWFVGMRYVALSYTASGFEEAAAANSLGISLGYLYRFVNE